MPYYGDSISFYYGGGPFSNHSSLMTGAPRPLGLHGPLSSRFSPHLSTISETSLSSLRRYSPVASSTPRIRRVIDTADIDVSTPRILSSRDENQRQRENRLRRDRPTIKIRCQALKDNPALREHHEKHERSVGELLVEKFLIKDKKLEDERPRLKLYHQAALEDDTSDAAQLLRRRVTRRMTRRRSSADLQLDPEQLQREAAYAQVQAKVLDSLVAEEQAEIEDEARRGTLIKRGVLGGGLFHEEESDSASPKIKSTFKKTKKRKKRVEKPSPTGKLVEEAEENVQSGEISSSEVTTDASVESRDEDEQQDAEKSSKLFKVEASNSVGDFSALLVKANDKNVDTKPSIEQFRESVRIPVPKKCFQSAKSVGSVDFKEPERVIVEEEVDTAVVLPVRKPYIKDTSRNSVYLTLKTQEKAKIKEEPQVQLGSANIQRGIANGIDKKELLKIKVRNTLQKVLEIGDGSKTDEKTTSTTQNAKIDSQGNSVSESSTKTEVDDSKRKVKSSSDAPIGRKKAIDAPKDETSGASSASRLPKASKITTIENNAVEAVERSLSEAAYITNLPKSVEIGGHASAQQLASNGSSAKVVETRSLIASQDAKKDRTSEEATVDEVKRPDDLKEDQKEARDGENDVPSTLARVDVNKRKGNMSSCDTIQSQPLIQPKISVEKVIPVGNGINGTVSTPIQGKFAKAKAAVAPLKAKLEEEPRKKDATEVKDTSPGEFQVVGTADISRSTSTESIDFWSEIKGERDSVLQPPKSARTHVEENSHVEETTRLADSPRGEKKKESEPKISPRCAAVSSSATEELQRRATTAPGFAETADNSGVTKIADALPGAATTQSSEVIPLQDASSVTPTPNESDVTKDKLQDDSKKKRKKRTDLTISIQPIKDFTSTVKRKLPLSVVSPPTSSPTASSEEQTPVPDTPIATINNSASSTPAIVDSEEPTPVPGTPVVPNSDSLESKVATPETEISVPSINVEEVPPTPVESISLAGEGEEDDEGPGTPTNEWTNSSIARISKWSNEHDLSNVENLEKCSEENTPISSNDASLVASPNDSHATSPASSKKKRVIKRKKSSSRKQSSAPESKKEKDKSTPKIKDAGIIAALKVSNDPRFSPRTSPRNSPAQRPLDLVRMFYTTPSALLTATPRDLSKVRRAKIKRRRHQSRTPSVSSDSTGSTASTATNGSTDGSGTSTCTEMDEDAEHKRRMASTRSNDSGFDGSPRISNCDMACHKKCEKLTGNLCGLNQKLVAEVLRTLKKAPSQSSDSQRNSDTPDHFPSGRVTPPALNLPRFKKYSVEDFNFLKVLGKGSFGKVLLAELRGTECVYAVKCLKKDVVLEDDDVECTLIERKVLTLATRHPYLCHLFCTFQTESHLFFVMEYLNGGDLMFHIQKSGRFPESRARFYAAEIWSGLNFLHKKGIVYRDLKLDNVLLDFEGHIRIADFGMCKLQIFLDRTADTFCGTPDYMAPEVIKGLKYNQAVDWWSYGVLLYEMLTGQSPFSGCDEDELFWSICNERPFIPRYLTQEATDLLINVLEKDASKRLPAHEIAVHPFFQSLPWDRLERRQLEPPFKPALEHTLDTKYFDTAFTAEKPRLTPVPEQILSSMDQGVFRGFSYTNPNATD